MARGKKSGGRQKPPFSSRDPSKNPSLVLPNRPPPHSGSPQHRVLFNLDIVRNIASFLDQPTLRRINSLTPAVYDAASRILYEHIHLTSTHQVKALLKLFSEDVQGVKEDSKIGITQIARYTKAVTLDFHIIGMPAKWVERLATIFGSIENVRLILDELCDRCESRKCHQSLWKLAVLLNPKTVITTTYFLQSFPREVKAAQLPDNKSTLTVVTSSHGWQSPHGRTTWVSAFSNVIVKQFKRIRLLVLSSNLDRTLISTPPFYRISSWRPLMSPPTEVIGLHFTLLALLVPAIWHIYKIHDSHPLDSDVWPQTLRNMVKDSISVEDTISDWMTRKRLAEGEGRHAAEIILHTRQDYIAGRYRYELSEKDYEMMMMMKLEKRKVDRKDPTGLYGNWTLMKHSEAIQLRKSKTTRPTPGV